MRSALTRVTLTDFRSYDHADLAIDGTAYLFGSNGAGKTNFLEAISFLAPGRGLRNATVSEVGRRERGEAQGRAWAVSAAMEGDIPEDAAQIGTGIEYASAPRRIVRVDGETVAPGRLLEHLRLVWLTPAQDRLFLEARSERLRFFDRLAFAAEPAHATAVSAYEKALRERLRLLTDGPLDEAWLNALEARLADAGAQAAGARARTLKALQDEIETRADRPFPQADLALSGPAEKAAAEGEAEDVIAVKIAVGLRASRERDAAAGRSLFGAASDRIGGPPSRAGPARGRMLHRRAKSADFEPGFGPGGAAFTCKIAAESYIVVRRSRGPPGPVPPGRPLRRNHRAGAPGFSDRNRRSAL